MRLTDAQNKLALEVLQTPGIAKLGSGNDEYVFAWIALDDGSVKAAIKATDKVQAKPPARSGALSGVENFLNPQDDSDRFPVTIEPYTGRVCWRLDLLHGVGPSGASLLRDLYCQRNVTMYTLVREIVLLRTSPRGEAILAEAARRDARDAEIRRQKKEEKEKERKGREAEKAVSKAREVIEHYEYRLDDDVPFFYLDVPCPTCAAETGTHCKLPSGHLLRKIAHVRDLSRLDPDDRKRAERQRKKRNQQSPWLSASQQERSRHVIIHSHRARRELHPKAQAQRTRHINEVHLQRSHRMGADLKAQGLLPWSVGRQSQLDLETDD